MKMSKEELKVLKGAAGALLALRVLFYFIAGSIVCNFVWEVIRRIYFWR